MPKEKMSIEDRIRAQGVKVEGTFDKKKFEYIWGLLLSEKYGVKITVTLHEENKDEQNDKIIDNDL